MILHKFVSSWANLNNLSFEITFFKKSGWRVVKSDRLVNLHAPLLFNIDAREGWSLMEDELNAYIEKHSQHVENDGEGDEDNFVQPSNTEEFPYQQPYYDYGPSVSSSSREPNYDRANDDPPAWSYYPRWD
jgi:hypothetical protein